MTPEEFRKAKEIFHAALERPDPARHAFVEEACSGDGELRREVESLLASARSAADFLDAARLPALGGAEGEAAPPEGPSPEERRRIGPYTIVREIGRGGMGSVFLAERSDREYRGRVALKLVKRGMDTEFILNRFRSERQILASLNHPNIGKLLDGGTTEDGLPYFVMEYIEGQHLTEYSQSLHLSIHERIGLFRTVCAAVQYAHQNLVVHRDIKPSNLMVTEDGTVKLLDFGLAKVLDPQRSGESFYQTVAGVGIFTPEYASPEQVRSEPVTTSTDIYSLGVVLYELLSGVHPYRNPDASSAELLKAILETEPEAPSAAAAGVGDAGCARVLQGDLDTVVLKALRKEPERRYATVERLSADLRRHLEGLPVSARPDTLLYRFGKFVRRHKLSVAAALLVAASLAAGLGIALWQARAARQSERVAKKRFDEVRTLAHTVLFDLHDRIRPLPGSTPVRALLVRTALDYLNGLALDAGHDRTLLRELVEAYVRVGDVQGGLGVGSLGDTSGAVASYRKALSIGEALCSDPRADSADRFAVSEALERMSDVLWLTGDRSGSLEAARRAVAIDEELLAASPGDGRLKARLARALHVLADAQEEAGAFAAAVECARREVRLYEDISRADPDDTVGRSKVAIAREELGYALLLNGDTESAVRELRTAAEIGRALLETDPGNADFQRVHAFTHMDLGEAYAAAKAWDDALGAFAASRSTFDRILAADPENANVRRNLGTLYSKFGHALVRAGRRSDGIALERRGLAILKRVCDEDRENAAARRETADAEARLAESAARPPR